MTTFALTVQNPDRFYIRASTGEEFECQPLPVSGGGATGASTSFVYRPGGTPADGVFVTSAALKAGLLTVDPSADKVIVVDTSIAGSAHLTAADSPWPLDNATIESSKIDILTVDAGATFTPGTSNLRLRNMELVIDAASAAAVWAPASPVAFLDLQTAVLANASATPWIDVANGVTFAVSLRAASSLAVGKQAAIENGGAVQLVAFDGSTFVANSFAHGAAAGGQLLLTIDGASQPFASTAQDNANLTVTEVTLDPQPTLVFKPAGSAQGNVFTTWATLMAARALVAGFCRIDIDPSLGACHATPGTWNITNTYFSAVDVSTNPSRLLIIDDGCSFGGSAVCWFENIVLENHNLTTSPFVAAGGIQLSHKFYFGTLQCVAGAVPMYAAPGAGQAVSVTLFATAQVANGGAPVFANTVGGGTTSIRLLDNTTLGASTTTGTGTVTVRYVDSAIFTLPQGVTTFTLVPLEPANATQASGNAGTGTGTVSVTTGNIQQKKSGQVLVIANIGGVTSAGTTVTLQLVRDAGTNIGNTIVETTLSAGDGFHGSITFVDTLPDSATHTYKLTATAAAGNITPGGANSAQITAVELS